MPKTKGGSKSPIFDSIVSLQGLLVLVSALFVFIFWDYVTYRYLFFFRGVGADTFSQFYPSILHRHDMIYSEGLPRWTFSIGLGQNMYPASLNNPPKLLLTLMPRDWIAYGLIWLEWVKYLLTASAFYLFLRKRRNRKPAAFLGALALTFGGYMLVGCTWYGHSDIVTFMAIGLLSVEMVIDKRRWWLLPLVVVLLSGTRLAFFLEFTALYAVIRLLVKFKGDLQRIRPVFGALLISGAIGVLLALPLQASAIFNILNSPRLTGAGESGSSLSSLSPFHLGEADMYLTALYRLFSPNMVGTANEYEGWFNWLEGPNFYCSILVLLLAPQFFALATKRKRKLYTLFMAFWGLILVFPWFRQAMYLFAGDYFKTFVSVFFPITLIILATNAFHYLLRGKKVHLPLLSATVLLSALLLYLPLGEMTEEVRSGTRSVVTASLVVNGLILGLSGRIRSRQLLFGLLALAMVAEIGYIGRETLQGRKTISVEIFKSRNFYNDYTLEALDRIGELESGDSMYRTDKLYGSAGRGFGDALAQGYRGSKSYQSFNNSSYISFLEDLGLLIKSPELRYKWIFGVSKKPDLHPLLSIKYLLSNGETQGDVDRDWYEPIGTYGFTTVYRNEYFVPFGIPFSDYFPRSEFELMDYDQRQRSLARGLVLEEEDAARFPALNPLVMEQAPSGKRDLMRLYRDLGARAMDARFHSNDHLSGDISLAEPAIVMFSIPYNPGWSIRANGQKKEVLVVDSGLMGIYLEPGVHEVSLRYTPTGFWWGWTAFLAGLGLYVFLLVRTPAILQPAKP